MLFLRREFLSGNALARLAACLMMVLLVMPSSEAAAERRVALVIGNSSYINVPRLPNPAYDATAINAKLKKLGFDVVFGVDVTRAGFARALKQFARKAANADVALFYYAGHGMQVNGRNYLLPTNARLRRARDLRGEMVTLGQVMNIMDIKAKTKIVFLDACRNNPLRTTLKKTLRTTRAARISGMSARTLNKGLAQIRGATGGTFIAFATAPGKTAADGDGRHSPFTDALLRHMSTSGLEISEMMRRVQGDVETKVKRYGFRQTPWRQSSLGKKFFFKRGSMMSLDAPPMLFSIGAGGL